MILSKEALKRVAGGAGGAGSPDLPEKQEPAFYSSARPITGESKAT